MTKEQKLKLIYRHTHRDYKGVIGGVGAIMILRQGGTQLVGVTSLTDAEIKERLPYAIRKESRRLGNTPGGAAEMEMLHEAAL